MNQTSIIETSKIGSNTEIMEYCVIRPGVEIGKNVVIHPNVVIESGVKIEDGVEIFPGSYIGKIPKGVGATARPISYDPRITISNDCAVGPNAVIFYDVEIGNNTLIGDGASLREKVRIGHHCIISRYVTINYHSKIGNHTKIMDLTHITGNCNIGNHVFISVSVSTVNDNVVVGQKYEEQEIVGPLIDDNVTVGAGAILLPGIKIGKGAFIAAGAVATRDVQPFDVVMGIPGKVVRNIISERGRNE